MSTKAAREEPSGATAHPEHIHLRNGVRRAGSYLASPTPPPTPPTTMITLPPFKGAWSSDFATGLAKQLAYKNLKDHLVAFETMRDRDMFDFFETPSMHTPILYMDVRNRLKFHTGMVQSTAQFAEALARAVFLVVRVYQDTCACEQVMGSSTVGHIPALFHTKVASWIRAHFRHREVMKTPSPTPSGTHTTRDPVARGSTSLAARGRGRRDSVASTGSGRPRGVVPQYPSTPATPRGHPPPRHVLSAKELDYVQTGWGPTLGFTSIITRVQTLVEEAVELPLPVWVPQTSPSMLPGTCTIYFGNALPNMVAAASNNRKIASVRAAAAATMLKALKHLRTWKNFLALTFAAERPTRGGGTSSTTTGLDDPPRSAPSGTTSEARGEKPVGFLQVVAPG